MTRSSLFQVAALVSGIVFGIGLAISRMIDPAKVQGFLDFAAIPSGGWDPSLALVMGGGVLVALVGMRVDRVLKRPIIGPVFSTAGRRHIDPQLVGGAAIFGVGWGLSGFCPGPAFADVALIPGSVALFVGALLVGSWLAGLVLDRQLPPKAAAAPA